MDPSALLSELRRLATIAQDELLSPTTRNGHARRLAEGFQELDEWLSRGGFSPDPWVTSNTTTVEQVVHVGSALDDVRRELSAASTLVEELVQELNAHPTWRRT